MKNISQRFAEKIRKIRDGCWLWTASKNNKGYGVIGRGGKNGGMMYAHRLSWTLANPGMPLGAGLVLHMCDVRHCVNPEHLLLGTHKDNVSDMWKKGRANHVKGERVHTAKLTATEVLAIRRLFVPWSRDANGTSGLAKRFGVSRQQIHSIISRQHWNHLEGPL